MKTRYLAITLILFAATGSACNSEKKAANIDPHAGMNHNTTNSLAANQNTSVHDNMNHADMKSSPNAENAQYDLQFIDTMIAHHQGAVEMAKSAQTKAGHAEIKSLAANIIVSQEKEIKEMTAWRDKWFAGQPLALNMKMAGMSDSMTGMDMKKLDSLAGNAFDLEFIKQMTPHHEGAVTMANDALKKSSKAEIKTLAAAIIKAQESEIKQMKEWQSAWSEKK